MNKNKRVVGKRKATGTAWKTVRTNIYKLPNGSYLVRKMVDGKRVSNTCKTIKACNAWLAGNK